MESARTSVSPSSVTAGADGIYLIEPDAHRPFHCPRFANLIYQVMAILRCNYINLGDFVDWFQLSQYDKDPRRRNTIVDDLELFAAHLDELERLTAPGSTADVLCGNHEDRLRRYLWRNAPLAAGFTATIPDLLGFPARQRRGLLHYRWHALENWDSCRIGDTLIHHGHYFDRHTAANNLQRYRGVNFIQGHTHRIQYVTNGTYFSATLGHGANNRKIAHVPAPDDHDQAFGILTVHGGRGSLEIIRVTDGACRFRGRLLKG